jgi:hypothetical protein
MNDNWLDMIDMDEARRVAELVGFDVAEAIADYELSDSAPAGHYLFKDNSFFVTMLAGYIWYLVNETVLPVSPVAVEWEQRVGRLQYGVTP